MNAKLEARMVVAIRNRGRSVIGAVAVACAVAASQGAWAAEIIGHRLEKSEQDRARLSMIQFSQIRTQRRSRTKIKAFHFVPAPHQNSTISTRLRLSVRVKPAMSRDSRVFEAIAPLMLRINYLLIMRLRARNAGLSVVRVLPRNQRIGTCDDV